MSTADKMNTVASELEELFRQDSSKPFPYRGCRVLIETDYEHGDGFIPDLDLYNLNMAGYACRAKRLNKRSREEIAKAKTSLSRSFFEMYPNYRPIEARITLADTPDLYEDMILHEKMRVKLIELISLIECDQELAELNSGDSGL